MINFIAMKVGRVYHNYIHKLFTFTEASAEVWQVLGQSLEDFLFAELSVDQTT